jgi:hypothetical protein
MLRRPPDPPAGKARLTTTLVAQSRYHGHAPLLAELMQHLHLATGGLLPIWGSSNSGFAPRPTAGLLTSPTQKCESPGGRFEPECPAGFTRNGWPI